MTDGIDPGDYVTDQYYIDGDLAYVIGCIEQWGEFNTFREASEKTATLVQQSPVGILLTRHPDDGVDPELVRKLRELLVEM